MNIVVQGLNALYTLCHWVAGQKSIISMYKKWPIFVWKKAGDSHPDYTSASLETPGVRNEVDNILREAKDPIKERLDKAMKAPIDHEAIRKAGW